MLKYKLIILFLSSICGIFSFLPIILQYNIPNDSSSSSNDSSSTSNNLYSINNSNIIENINFSMITASILLLFESLLDWNTLFVSYDYTLPRWIIIFICLFTSILFYFYNTDKNEQIKLELLICCFYSRASLFSGCLLYQVENQITFLSQSFIIILQLLLLATVQLYLWKCFFRVGELVFIISSLFGFICGLICSFYCLRTCWIYGLKPILATANQASVTEKYRLVIATCIGLYIFGNLIVSLSFGSKEWSETGSTEICLYYIIDILILVFTYHIPGRMAHYDAGLLKFQLQSKRAFVRYVGHEIRTPLNTVSLGLDLLHSTIKPYLQNNSSKLSPSLLHNMNRMISDVSDSANIAIDILNDLLLYDKIEEGNLVIYPEKLNVQHLITSLVSNFSIQAQQCQVQLTYDPTVSINLPSLSTSSPTRRDVSLIEMNADKSKVSQVLRNFISNALKFTPKGGCVRVVHKFLPIPTVASSSVSGSASVGNISATLVDGNIHRERSSSDARPSFVSTIVRDAIRSKANSSTVYASNIDVDENECENIVHGILRIEVHDTGCGIIKENQQKLFKSVVQFDTALLQSGKGSGLGLWISNAIIERHGGNIGVVSSGIAGEGSIFYLELPALIKFQMLSTVSTDNAVDRSNLVTSTVTLPQPTLSEVVESIVDSSSYRISTRNSQINSQSNVSEIFENSSKSTSSGIYLNRALVVDDSKMNRRMLTQALTPYFREISQAEDGQQALDIFQESLNNNLNNNSNNNNTHDDSNVHDLNNISSNISIIFMDSLMPVMTGIEATQLLRQYGYLGPIIGVTGNMMKEDVEQFKAAGATEVMGKPLKLEQLSELLSTLFQIDPSSPIPISRRKSKKSDIEEFTVLEMES